MAGIDEMTRQGAAHAADPDEAEMLGHDRLPLSHATPIGGDGAAILSPAEAWHDAVAAEQRGAMAASFKIRLKRLNLLNCDASFPSILVFP